MKKSLYARYKLEDGDTITDPKQIEKELENFYSNMYTSKKKLFIANTRALSHFSRVLKSLN